MDLKKKEIHGRLLLTIMDKEANLTSAELFKEALFREISEGNTRLIVSFQHVDYIDSSFLGALVAVLKRLLPLQGSLVLVELNNDIRNLFELTRLDKIFDLRNSLDTALETN